MRGKQLKIEQDEEDVISMVKEELKLDPSVRQKWYFDQLDPQWVPSVRDQLSLERGARCSSRRALNTVLCMTRDQSSERTPGRVSYLKFLSLLIF